MARTVRSRALSLLAVALVIALSTLAFWRYGFSATSASVVAGGYGKDGGYGKGYEKEYGKGYSKGHGGYGHRYGDYDGDGYGDGYDGYGGYDDYDDGYGYGSNQNRLSKGEGLQSRSVTFPDTLPSYGSLGAQSYGGSAASSQAGPVGTPAPEEEFALDEGEVWVYVVAEGDTLPQIAAWLGVPLAALLEANGLTGYERLTVGQELIIPEGGFIPVGPSPFGTQEPAEEPAPAATPAPQEEEVEPLATPTAEEEAEVEVEPEVEEEATPEATEEAQEEAAAEEAATPEPEPEPTLEPSEEMTATEEIEGTGILTETEPAVETEGITGTEGITETEAVTETESMTETGPMTETEAMTETEGLAETEEMTGTEGITETGVITVPEVFTETETTGTEGTTGTEVTPSEGITATEELTGTEEITPTEPATDTQGTTGAVAPVVIVPAPAAGLNAQGAPAAVWRAPTQSVELYSPVAGGAYHSPIQVTGLSSTFAGTVGVSLLDADGAVLADRMTTGGIAGEYAFFHTELRFSVTEPTAAVLNVVDMDMAEGTVMAEVHRPLVLLPGQRTLDITYPYVGAIICGDLLVAGYSNTFEANVVLELRERDGDVLAQVPAAGGTLGVYRDFAHSFTDLVVDAPVPALLSMSESDASGRYLHVDKTVIPFTLYPIGSAECAAAS